MYINTQMIYNIVGVVST